MEVEAGEVGSGAAEVAGGAVFGVGVVDEDVDVFDLGEVADDFGVDPGNGLEFSGPVLGVVGPGDPGGGVGSPLGGHAVVGRLLVGAQWVPPTGRKVCKVFQRDGLVWTCPGCKITVMIWNSVREGPRESAPCQVKQSPRI